jgi:hypothetical protein
MKATTHTLSVSMLLAASLACGSAWAAAPTKAAGTAKSSATRKAPPAAAHQAPQAPTGILKAPYDEFNLTLMTWDGARMIAAAGTKGQASVKPGNYYLTGWELHTKDAAGHVWRATGGPFGQPQQMVRVSRGSTSVIRIATPLKLDLQIDQVGADFSFLMRFLSTSGDRCTRIYMDGENPPAPKLKITDADGAPVETLEFKFGCGFVCRKIWKAPEGVKWPLKGTIEIDFGPFPVDAGEPLSLRQSQ